MLLLHPDADKDDFHLELIYRDDSSLKLQALNIFGESFHYRLSGMMYNITMIQKDGNQLLKCIANLYVDLYPTVEVESKTTMILKINAVNGGSSIVYAEDNEYGGFIHSRGLEEFLYEGLNDFMIKQLGHKAFGSGMRFVDHSTHSGDISVMPLEDGIYITLY